MSDVLAKNTLIECNISPSRPRVAILAYLKSTYNHPTADEIFRELRGKVPTLSLTTVYNTCKLFADKGICQSLTINEKQVCFDGHTHPHSHFLCNKCGKLYDLPHQEIKLGESMLNGHQVSEVHCYFKGVCSECLKECN